MKTFLAVLLMVGNVAAANPAPVWEIRKGLSAPECAYLVPGKDWLLISNVGGDAGAKDGVGWITKAAIDGKVIKAKWVSGLNAPKGLASAGGKIYVADIDELVEIELESGKILHRYRAPDAKMLNDVAVDTLGKIYVSDTLANKIYTLESTGLVPFLEGEMLEGPNGLAILNEELYVAGWGTGIAADWSTKVPGRVLSFDLRTHARREVSQLLGNLDGLARIGDSWVVSDWVAGKVYLLKGAEAPVLILEDLGGSADVAWYEKDRLLIVPRMKENAVSAYRLE